MFKGEYPSEWSQLARSVKDAAGWRCVRCNHAHAPDLGRTLTVHHFDGDKANSAAWNLMALCQACHLSVQARVNPQVPLMFAPSVWAMPYVAGFYNAGRGVPGPLFDAEQWKREYEASGRTWPEWAEKRGTVAK